MARFVVFSGALVMLLVITARLAVAQEATPETVPIAPDPAECQVSPRTVDEILAIAATPSAAAATPPPGRSTVADQDNEPADAETVAAVTATVREIVACGNANKTFSVLAFYTDGFLGRIFPPGGEVVGDPNAIEATPRARLNRLALAAVRDVTLLSDGRVSAIVEVGAIAALDDITPDLLIFALVDGRYRVDEVIAGGAVGMPTPSS